MLLPDDPHLAEGTGIHAGGDPFGLLRLIEAALLTVVALGQVIEGVIEVGFIEAVIHITVVVGVCDTLTAAALALAVVGTGRGFAPVAVVGVVAVTVTGFAVFGLTVFVAAVVVVTTFGAAFVVAVFTFGVALALTVGTFVLAVFAGLIAALAGLVAPFGGFGVLVGQGLRVFPEGELALSGRGSRSLGLSPPTCSPSCSRAVPR